MILLSKPSITQDEIKNVTDVIKRGNLSQAGQVNQFEEATAKFLGVDSSHIVALSSGTAALNISSILLEPRLNHQIMHTPAITFISTPNCITGLDKETDATIKIEDIE